MIAVYIGEKYFVDMKFFECLCSFEKCKFKKKTLNSASLRFRDACVRKIGINKIWTDRFSSCLAWGFQNAVQSVKQNFKLKYGLDENIE